MFQFTGTIIVPFLFSAIPGIMGSQAVNRLSSFGPRTRAAKPRETREKIRRAKPSHFSFLIRVIRG